MRLSSQGIRFTAAIVTTLFLGGAGAGCRSGEEPPNMAELQEFGESAVFGED